MASVTVNLTGDHFSNSGQVLWTDDVTLGAVRLTWLWGRSGIKQREFMVWQGLQRVRYIISMFGN